MDRKAVAKQTVAIMERGFYEVDGGKDRYQRRYGEVPEVVF